MLEDAPTLEEFRVAVHWLEAILCQIEKTPIYFRVTALDRANVIGGSESGKPRDVAVEIEYLFGSCVCATRPNTKSAASNLRTDSFSFPTNPPSPVTQFVNANATSCAWDS